MARAKPTAALLGETALSMVVKAIPPVHRNV